jgi:putative ABC transport system permease protein
VKALDKKLLRDVLRLRGQVITIALVVACGITSYVAVVGTYGALVRARDTYYERQRFADVFADVTRAPKSLRARIEQLPEVALVATSLRSDLRVITPDISEPARGLCVSIDPLHPAPLDAVRVVSGRMPGSGRADEALLIQSFANAHHIRVGDRLALVLEGVRRNPRVVGIAISPDYVFPIAPGEISFDAARYAVVWTDESVLARAVRMEGAFTHLSLRVQPQASRPALLQTLDRMLAPYGGRLAHGRDKHPSNALIDGELAQLRSMATIIPLIFLGVAAFLVNVVLSRLVQLERPEIAALKAIGYPDRALGAHYVKLVSLIVWLGAALGLAGGAYFGGSITRLYMEYFTFPELRFTLEPQLFLQALLVSLVSAFAGALLSARAVMRLPPAEAMRPPEPVRYGRPGESRRVAAKLLGPWAAMVLRELARRPWRLFFSSLGIAMAVAVLVVGRFSLDTIGYLMEVQFQSAQREDFTVAFARALPPRAVSELAHLPGVLRAEGLRALPVRVSAGYAVREAALTGLEPATTLRRIVDSHGRVFSPPASGVLLTRKLAQVLGVRPGDRVRVESLEGAPRPHAELVRGTVDDLFGLNVYMRLDALHRFLHEQPRVSTALLVVDPREAEHVTAALADRPAVLGVSRRSVILELFNKQTAQQTRIMTMTLTFFAAIIAAGVVYNNARVSLSLRAHDLASLRVLGFRRSEISGVLLSELAVQTLLGLAPGMLIGRMLVSVTMSSTDPELFRFPLIVSAQTYAFAISVTLIAALLSALLVRHRLDHLDLIAVLKTRE